MTYAVVLSPAMSAPLTRERPIIRRKPRETKGSVRQLRAGSAFAAARPDGAPLGGEETQNPRLAGTSRKRACWLGCSDLHLFYSEVRGSARAAGKLTRAELEREALDAQTHLRRGRRRRTPRRQRRGR